MCTDILSSFFSPFLPDFISQMVYTVRFDIYLFRFCFRLEFAIAAVSNHVRSPEANQSPPADSPSSPETLHTLTFLVRRLEVLGLEFASLAYYGLGWDLPVALFGDNVVHCTEDAMVFPSGHNSLQSRFAVIESFQILRLREHGELTSAQNSLQRKLNQNSN